MITTVRSSQPNPGEPYRLMSYFMFLTVIGAGILLALNWKKPGKPEWQSRTIILSIFLPIAMVVVALVWIILVSPHPELPIQFILSLLMLARLQCGAYKMFTREGSKALQSYEYDGMEHYFLGAWSR